MVMHVRIALAIVLLAGMLAGCGTALGKAAYNGDLATARMLLDQGADVNESHFYPACDYFAKSDLTPLHCAVVNGNVEMAQLLLERGADINIGPAFNHATPLMTAALHGETKMVKFLLDRGADPAVTVYGTSALKWAQEHNHTSIVRLLEQAEARQLGTAPLVARPAQPDVASPPPMTSVAKSDVDTLPAQRSKTNVRAHAVLIGIEQYQQKLPKADFAAHDAEIMGQYLTRTLGYAEENVVVLLNDRATKTGVEKYIEGWLPDRVEKDDSVFIYFSGHGAPNPKTGKAFLVPYDGDPAFVDQTGYPLDRLYERLAALPAKEVIVMLDSCFSGAGGRSVIAKGMRPMVLSVENPVLARGKVLVLAASSGSQVSSTYDQKSHGLLTYFFLKGLQGEADRNKDGRVELGEVFEYLKPQVERTARREFHNEQTPQLLGSPQALGRGIRLVEPAGTSKP